MEELTPEQQAELDAQQEAEAARQAEVDAQLLAEQEAEAARQALLARISALGDINGLIGKWMESNPSEDSERGWNAQLVALGDESGWRVSDVLMPSLEDLESMTNALSASSAQKATNFAALAYLAETDWVVIRASERGEELSAEFKAQRDAARLSIVR